MLLEQNVPSVFYPNEDWSLNPKAVKPASFGPLPPFFTERVHLAGTFDDQWFDNRRPLYPDDFDEGFYQSAVREQQCDGILKGGERIVASGFHHDDAFSFFLPKLRFQANVVFANNESMTKEMELHTLFIDTEQELITACWSASFRCQGKEHLLTKTVITGQHLQE